jgi:hypothetical protein
MVELGLLGSKTNLDVSKTLPIGELGKSHAEKLVQACEPFDLPVALILLDANLKYMDRHVIHHLGENDFTFIHTPNPLAE